MGDNGKARSFSGRQNKLKSCQMRQSWKSCHQVLQTEKNCSHKKHELHSFIQSDTTHDKTICIVNTPIKTVSIATHLHAQTPTHAHVHTHAHTHTHLHTHTHIYIHTRTHTHINMHTHTHTRKHTNAHTQEPFLWRGLHLHDSVPSADAVKTGRQRSNAQPKGCPLHGELCIHASSHPASHACTQPSIRLCIHASSHSFLHAFIPKLTQTSIQPTSLVSQAPVSRRSPEPWQVLCESSVASNLLCVWSEWKNRREGGGRTLLD